jgi:hypothetical protein
MTPPLIQVCGDPTVDWMTIRSETEPRLGPFFWTPDQRVPDVGVSVQAGGSALITSLLKAIVPPGQAIINGVELAPELLENPFAPITRAWTVWQRQGKAKETSSFRIAEWSRHEPASWDYNAPDGCADLLVVEDTALGFSNAPHGWPPSLHSPDLTGPQQILVKFAQFNDGKRSGFLEKVVERGWGDRTTILAAVKDLRRGAVRIAESLSWERMLDEVVDAVRNPACPFLRTDQPHLAFDRVIITIGPAGAIIVGRDENVLIFDRSGQEGDLERRFPGGMMGYNTAVIGALAASWVSEQENTDWTNATRKGLAFARYLHVGGYAVETQRGREQIHFPSSAWEKIHADHSTPAKRDDTWAEAWNLGQFKVASQSTKRPSDTWTILGSVASRPEDVYSLACRVARKGPQELSATVPVESIGDWRSADRHEIEGVRGVRNLMQEYLQLKRPEKPIAFAVFGPPGSGKSFAVKEAAKAIGIEKDAQLTFNLSQFDSPTQLTGAFHQIRDLLLKGKIPLVFWDEFDTPCQDKPLGWLRYFLAPIQDGQFLDQGQVHPTGGGIYVFAGGTRSSFQRFRSDDSVADVDAKKPDFVSRLRGYIDVRGPNGYPNIVEDDLYMIRRAFLLNSLLERNAPQLKQSDEFAIRDQVLAALLRTTKYRHGTRSLESLVVMSTRRGRTRFDLSDLLSDELLGMHVDAQDFNAFTRPDYKGVLRVGISGHVNLDPAAIPRIEKGIGEALTKIEERFPHHYLTAFSPLSPGADRLVARKILEKTGARLIAVLPAPEQDYINDFGSEDSYSKDPGEAALRQELRHWLSERAIEVITLPPTPTRDEGYEQAGFYIAKYCDALIVVWDGGPSRGRGGTQHVVKFALKNRKIVWQVWASRFEGDPSSPRDIDNKSGTVELLEE